MRTGEQAAPDSKISKRSTSLIPRQPPYSSFRCHLRMIKVYLSFDEETASNPLVKKGNLASMSQAIELQLTCPQCETEFSHLGQTLVDMANEADSEALWQLQNGTLNQVKCPNCGAGGLIPIPVVLHIPEQEMLLVFAPGAQQMDEEQLGQLIGPVLETFITSLPPEKQAEYMLNPIVTDDLQAIQQAARGELVADDMINGGEYLDEDEEDEDDDDEGETSLTPEEQQALQARMQLIQTLFQASDSLERISRMRAEASLVDDLFLEVIGMLTEQAEQAQPEVVPTLRKMMNEAEVFISSNPHA